MDYESLMEKYRTKEAFIYGRSVMQIMEKKTYVESGVAKTDFIYKTERNQHGVITVTHKDPSERAADQSVTDNGA